MDELLSPHARAVAERALDEESAKRAHLVVYLSGAHAYGFPSPDSDLDLKAIHVERTERLLGLAAPTPTFDRAEIIDGVEIDYTSNELGAALLGVLRGNGNFIERVLGATALRGSPELEALRPLVARALSRRVHRHYRGFAEGQLRELDRTPTAKRLLYVLRTALTGLHLLRSAALVTDVRITAREHRVDGIDALIARKQTGERASLSREEIDAWRGRVHALLDALDAAHARSVLPEEPPNAGELEAWLVALRASRLAR